MFYLQRALRDEYQIPIRSLNIMPEVFSKKQRVDGVSYFSRDGGSLVPGLYYYKIFAVDKFNNIISSDEIKANLTLTVPSGSIHLGWNSASGASKYQVYGRTAEFEKMWEVYEPKFIDDGSNEGSLPGGIDEEEIEQYPYTLFPEFNVGGNSFTSPFLYKFNPLYNYYEGWLFYPELLVNFSSIQLTNQGELSAASLPSIFLNLIYDRKEGKTTVSVKSYQSINEWFFSITCPELGIYNKSMNMIDESTFSYEYTDNHGFIVDPVIMTFTGSMLGMDIFTAKTATVHQRYDLTDLLQIPTFPYQGITYMVDVPVIETKVFEKNETLYLDKILLFLVGFNLNSFRLSNKKIIMDKSLT